MARSTSPLVDRAAHFLPLFADPQRDYHWLAGYDRWEREGATVRFSARDEEGRPLDVRLTPVDPAVLRVQLLTPGAAEPPPTPLLLSEDWPRVTLSTEETSVGLRLRSSGMVVDVQREPWRVSVSAAGRPVFRQEIDDRALDRYVAFPFGYSSGEDGRVDPHETFALEPGERLYGLGEQFGALERRGQRHVSWVQDTFGTNTTPLTYLETPLLLSSHGYGIFINHGERIIYELGHPSTVSASFRVDAPSLDYFLIAGPDLKSLLRRYAMLTGKPALPPLWSFGLWMSRCMYRNRGEVEESVLRMREFGIPVDVYHVDPLWLKARSRYERDACDFEWDDEAFGEAEGFVDWLRGQGVRLSLWENPYVWRGTPMYEEGVANGYFVRLPDGSPAPSLDSPMESVLIDYTNPAAVAWVKEKHRRWLCAGVAAFKTDYGEGVPEEAVFHDGRTGRELHNLYPLLYNRAVFETVEEVCGQGEAIVFGRSGYAGSQRYPLQWSGDAQSTWAGMAGALRAGLSAALSGTAFWAVDAGGFYADRRRGAPDPTLYIRWAQWAMFCSHTRFHGVEPREPWYFGDEAVAIVRAFARLRYRLLPYLWSLAHEAADTGLPVLRPLVLEYPDDPVAPHVDTQFLLGPSLLVCPVLNAEGRCRVYLPPGRWHDWWDGSVHEGPAHLDLTVPLDRLPLYVRDGSILPLAPTLPEVVAGAPPPVLNTDAPWDPIELQVRGESMADLALWTRDRRVPVRADRRHNRLRLRVENAAQRWRIRLLGVTATEAATTGAATGFTWSQDGPDTVAEFTMTGQGSAQLTATLA